MVFIQAVYFKSAAQTYTGYHSSAYAGVYSIVTSPADILNHRTRGDLNLVGFSTGIGNSVISKSINTKKEIVIGRIDGIL